MQVNVFGEMNEREYFRTNQMYVTKNDAKDPSHYILEIFIAALGASAFL